jgi:HK97 family phage major capsid protein
MSKKTETLGAELEVIRSELAELEKVDEPTDEQVERAKSLLGDWDTKKAAYDAAVEYDQKIEAVRSAALNRPATESGDGAKFGAPEVMRRVDPFEVLRTGAVGMNQREIKRAMIDGNLKALEDKDVEGENQAHFERVIKRHADDFAWAGNILARSRPEYESGWAKLMMGRPELLDELERTAMSSGSNTNGGYLIPTHLDPTIILTNSGTSNVIRGISRVVTLTEGTTWNGVTSAGVTASWDGELVEVSDDTPTFGRVSVATNVAQSFVQASISAFQDISGLQSDVMMMFADARDRLEGAAHATGSGSSNQPKGIVTALDASTSVEVTSTTAATIGLVDLHALYRAVPVRWRGRGTWLMNPLYSLAVKALGTAISASYSGDLREPVAGRILGRPLVESDDMPTTQTTTALDNEIIYGDFSNYLIVDKPGSMSVEFIPHLFNTSNNLPDGRRGWYAYWRTGADSTNISAFRILQDKTSA